MNFTDQLLENPLSAWAIALALTVLTYLFLRIVQRLVSRKLATIAQTTATRIDDVAGEVLSGTRSFFLITVSVNIGSLVLDLPPSANQIIGHIVVLAVFIQVGIWVSRGIAFVLTRSMRDGTGDDPASATMLTPMLFITQLIVWAVIILLALDNVGVDVTALITGLGIGGIAVALALHTILGDLFASLAIVLDKPFVIGDFITVAEFSGTIEHVGLKTTRVRSLTGEQIVIGNSDLLSSRIRNFKRMEERRALFVVGVTYQTPYEKLRQIPEMIKEIIVKDPVARFDRCHFKQFADSSLNFETVYFVLAPDYITYMDRQQAINLEVYRKFEAEGIEFAYPTQTLYLEKGEKSEEEVGPSVPES